MGKGVPAAEWVECVALLSGMRREDGRFGSFVGAVAESMRLCIVKILSIVLSMHRLRRGDIDLWRCMYESARSHLLCQHSGHTGRQSC